MLSRITIHGHTSEALREQINTRLNKALDSFESAIADVVVTVSDENGAKSGTDDRRFHAVVTFRGGGDVIVDERGSDAYDVVTTGVERVKMAVGRKLEKKHDKHHGAAANPHHSGIVQ